jgi:hypothetical protein
MRVDVIMLDMPKPCGTIANQSENCEVLSLQVAIVAFAIIGSNAEMTVSLYNLPV